ncbi:hypothetical protein GCM10023405_48620 [Streptomonospora salina]
MAVLLTGTAVLSAATLALWAGGGLARADTDPGRQPGDTVRTAMYTMTPHEAEFVTDDTGTTALQVRADLVSEHTEPVPVSAFGRAIGVAFPSGEIDASALSVSYTRHPDGLVFDIQPDMREEVLMTWSLQKAESDGQDRQEDSDSPLAGLGGDPGPSDPLDAESLLEGTEDVAPLAEKEDTVTLTFNKTEFSPGFTDRSESWRPTDEVAAETSFPLRKG